MEFKEDLDRIHQAGINITLHAGEEYSLNSKQNLKDAIENLHAGEQCLR